MMRKNNQKSNGSILKKDSAFCRQGRKLSAVFDAESPENATEMGLDRRQAQTELAGNLLVAVAVGHQLNDPTILIT
mgnify:CR=1 FL=1